MVKKKSQDEARILQKKNDKMMKRKLQYDKLQKKIQNNNIPIDKLSIH